MSKLPKILPLSKTIHLPIIDKDVKIYAFTVKEEKTILIAKDFGDNNLEANLLELMKLKSEGVDVDSLCMADTIVLLVEILALSKSATQELVYMCSNEVKGKPCNTRIELSLDISKYKVSNKSEEHKLIKLDDNISVELVYPKYKSFVEFRNKENPTEEDISNLYVDCIFAIYSGEEMITDFTKEELIEWFNELPGEYLKYFTDFITNMPKVTIDYDVVCPKCKNTRHFEAVNLLDFFTPDTQG